MAAGEAAGRYRSGMGKSKDPSGLLISVIRYGWLRAAVSCFHGPGRSRE